MRYWRNSRRLESGIRQSTEEGDIDRATECQVLCHKTGTVLSEMTSQ